MGVRNTAGSVGICEIRTVLKVDLLSLRLTNQNMDIITDAGVRLLINVGRKEGEITQMAL